MSSSICPQDRQEELRPSALLRKNTGTVRGDSVGPRIGAGACFNDTFTRTVKANMLRLARPAIGVLVGRTRVGAPERRAFAIAKNAGTRIFCGVGPVGSTSRVRQEGACRPSLIIARVVCDTIAITVIGVINSTRVSAPARGAGTRG